MWRARISRAEDIFDRASETDLLSSYLRASQSCQIVGPKRIGKSSLMRRLQAGIEVGRPRVRVAYLDLFDARCFTMAGLLASAGRQFGASVPPTTLVEFSDLVDEALGNDWHLLLCLDEFEELIHRRGEFTRDFFLTLRSCGQRGMSIVTASRKRLSDLTDAGDPTSPFYNTFAMLKLGPFSPSAAAGFVSLHRPGVTPFSSEQKSGILEFAKEHPLALQVACFHVLQALQQGDLWTAGLQRASEDIRSHIPTW